MRKAPGQMTALRVPGRPITRRTHSRHTPHHSQQGTHLWVAVAQHEVKKHRRPCGEGGLLPAYLNLHWLQQYQIAQK